MRLRQVCVVAPSLAPAVEEIREVLGLMEGHRDEGVAMWGLENRVMPVGHEFLEVVAPTREGTAAGRYLEKRGGAGGYMVILQVEEGLFHRRRITGKGVRTVFTADREPDIWITQYHPSDCGGIFLEIDSVNPEFDHLEPECPWPPAGAGWLDQVQTAMTDHICAVTLQSDDPGPMAVLWSDLLDHPVFDHERFWQMKLQNAAIRFQPCEDHRGAGIESVDIVVNDLDGVLEAAERRGTRTGERQVELSGMRVNLISR